MKTALFTTTLGMLMALSGCSDLFQKKVVDNKFDSDRFKVNCQLNVDEFALILEKPIQDSINCLGKNLELFIQVVETDRPGYLSRDALRAYIERYRTDIKPEVLNALTAVFDINFLVYGEDDKYISEANVKALIAFAVKFNENASQIFRPYFLGEDSLNYQEYQAIRLQKIKPAANEITAALKKIFNSNRNGEIHSLNIINVLQSFTTESNRDAMESVRKVLFGKKILLGGKKDVLTHVELSNLIGSFTSYVLLALDGVRYNDVRLNQKDLISFVKNDLEILQDLIYNRNTNDSESDEVFFTMDEALEAADMFITGDFDVNKYRDLLIEVKQILMPNENEQIVTAKDFKKLFTHSLSLLRKGTYFHRFWIHQHYFFISNTGEITDSFKKLYEQYSQEKELVDDFVRIVKKYRFPKGENISAYYNGTDDYHRNPEAVFEIASYEYILKLLFDKYGSPSDGLYGKSMSNDQVIKLMKKFKTALIEMDLITPGREVKTAETITLLGSLFQYQSDKNKVFDVNEATEFAISLFTAVDVSKELETHFKVAKCETDEFGRFHPDCFRKNFFKGVCQKYPIYYPKLFESLGATVYKPSLDGSSEELLCNIPDTEQNRAYLDMSIKAARACNIYPDTKEEIPYSKSDIMTIFMAMIHIETTILRWDTLQVNNYMDANEVMQAYQIYSPALDGFLKDKPKIIRRFKKQIFQYMIRYEQIPDETQFSSTWKFIRFLLSFNKGSSANRKTIASLLVAISSQGAPSNFDCNLLHNPTTIPDDYNPNPDPIAASVPAVLSLDDLQLANDIENQSDVEIKRQLAEEYGENFERLP